MRENSNGDCEFVLVERVGQLTVFGWKLDLKIRNGHEKQICPENEMR